MSPRILLFWYLKPWCNLFDLEDQNANINVLSEPEHTHVHEDVQITRSEIKNRLVQKVKQDPSLPIKRIYESVVREHGQGIDVCASAQAFKVFWGGEKQNSPIVILM
jgi:hypothetical protein